MYAPREWRTSDNNDDRSIVICPSILRWWHAQGYPPSKYQYASKLFCGGSYHVPNNEYSITVPVQVPYAGHDWVEKNVWHQWTLSYICHLLRNEIIFSARIRRSKLQEREQGRWRLSFIGSTARCIIARGIIQRAKTTLKYGSPNTSTGIKKWIQDICLVKFKIYYALYLSAAKETLYCMSMGMPIWLPKTRLTQ